MPRPLLVLNLAALTPSMVGPETPNLARLARQGGMRPLVPPLPALTCPSQVTLLTGLPPAQHGVVGNGWYDREHARIFHWNRSARMMGGEPLWETARKREPRLRCANLFFRFAAHSSCDLVVTERPTYYANGRKGADVYTEPGELRDRLYGQLGRFPFFYFWGPLAGIDSSRWILAAGRELLREQRPELLFVYAPFLDYDIQRHGPHSPQARQAVAVLDREIEPLLEAARDRGLDIAVVSEYGFAEVHRPVFPNRELRRAGYLTVQQADNGELLEPGTSRAFAVCDNQAAHVYVRDASDVAPVRELLAALPGVREVLDAEGKARVGLDHPRSGELIALAERDAWFAYPYWLDEACAPDFVRCIDIFNKPGFDPCELLLAPGLRGKLHLGRRMLQMRSGLRTAFDVIDPDPYRIRGSRDVALDDPAHGPALLTSWSQTQDDPMPLAELKAHLLARMFEG